MKLYLSKGSIWTGTQADAKAAQGDNSFETIEVPTDKPNLMAWLNEHWPSDTGGAAPSGRDEPEEEPVEDDEELPAPPPPVKVGKTTQSGACVTCGRTLTGYHWLKQGDIQSAVVEAIDQIDQPWALNNIADALEERGNALGLKPVEDA